jgi:N-acyl-D-aspartate/D-glutamate deacylase
MRTATSVARARETVLQAAQQRAERVAEVALFRKDQRLYGPENLAIRLSRNGISEKPKLIFRNTKKNSKTFFFHEQEIG